MAVKKYFACVEAKIKVEFYDVDSMDIVYHGNYVQFLERARCFFLEKLNYTYVDMKNEGYAFPIVELSIKYMRSLKFREEAVVKVYLTEYENCLKFDYEIFNQEGVLVTKASTTQMVIDSKTNKTLFVCPQSLIKKVESFIGNKE
ncbi:MAG: acyl-CoA thioesterase [Treponema sp.]|nr:acyl-CoA thioesterase [Treponema sp.]